MKDIYRTFEFDQIKKLVKDFLYSDLTKKWLDDLVMYQYQEDLVDELEITKEAIRYCYKYSRPNLYAFSDLTKSFDFLNKGGMIEVEEIYMIYRLIDNVNKLKEDFLSDTSFVLINQMIKNLIALPHLKTRIERVISKDLNILDDASSTLKSLRRAIFNEENSQSKIISSLMNRYKNYLNDERVALKNNVMTLPIKTGFKNKVEGVVVAVSDSGLTTFIEPNDILISNNRIQQMKRQEIEEINRILKELCLEITASLDSLILDFNTMMKLEYIIAKGQFGVKYDAHVARIVDQAIIDLKGARHPLIDPLKVVKNTFLIDKQKIVLITGPNAGGKTVALKLVGLCVIMNQCGLPLLVSEEPKLGFFRSIFADIGDSQSLIDNLSTFSGHITSLVEITSHVDSHSLVIIDELGTGTSPLDGEALGIGIIEYLLSTGAVCLISSHYEGLKNYALESKDIIPACMIFDEEKLIPTYQLRLGLTGHSYGLEVAKRLGLDQSILDAAKGYIENKKETDKEITLAILQQKLEQNDSLKLELEELKKNLIEKQDELINKENLLLKEKNRLNQEVEEIKAELVQEAKDKIEAIVSEFKSNNQYPTHVVIKAKHRLDQQVESKEEELISDEISINDAVMITTSSIRGKVVRIQGENVTILSDYGMSISVKKNQLQKIQQNKKAKVKKQYVPTVDRVLKTVKLELNIIGYRVEEALPLVRKYLDDAVLSHYKEVRIIHGSGTGALRTAVHEYLKKSPYVESFRLGGMNEGGVGATVVSLK